MRLEGGLGTFPQYHESSHGGHKLILGSLTFLVLFKSVISAPRRGLESQNAIVQLLELILETEILFPPKPSSSPGAKLNLILTTEWFFDLAVRSLVNCWHVIILPFHYHQWEFIPNRQCPAKIMKLSVVMNERAQRLRNVILPLVKSYGLNSIVTLSPTKIFT